MHVCLLGPGTRRRYAICVFAPRVPLPGFLCVLTHATPRSATWHDIITYLRSWWRCVACLLFVCMRRHTFCPLSLPFASYINRRAGGRWARLGYATWSPFTFVGVVAVHVSCPLRSVAWHATYLDPTSNVCMLGFFFFFFFFFFFCCALPRWSFYSSSLVPSYHVARPWRCWPCGVPGMRVRAYLSFPM